MLGEEVLGGELGGERGSGCIGGGDGGVLELFGTGKEGLTRGTGRSQNCYQDADRTSYTLATSFSTPSVTPASLTIVASCSQNGNTYPVGPTNSLGQINNVVPGSATQIVWNPYQYEQQPGATPLQAATYRLSVWDERDVWGDGDEWGLGQRLGKTR